MKKLNLFFLLTTMFVALFLTSCADTSDSPEKVALEEELTVSDTGITNETSSPPDPMMKALYLKMQDSKNVLSRKNYDGGGFQVVFVENSKRYTVYCSENLEDKIQESVMSFWVRPEGTSSPDDLTTFSDENFDAKVDFGITGKGDKKFISLNDLPKEGDQHQYYWQNELSVALENAYRHFEITGWEEMASW